MANRGGGSMGGGNGGVKFDDQPAAQSNDGVQIVTSQNPGSVVAPQDNTIQGV